MTIRETNCIFPANEYSELSFSIRNHTQVHFLFSFLYCALTVCLQTQNANIVGKKKVMKTFSNEIILKCEVQSCRQHML